MPPWKEYTDARMRGGGSGSQSGKDTPLVRMKSSVAERLHCSTDHWWQGMVWYGMV